MCDYSLHAVRTRDAVVGDRLITTSFSCSTTRGLADPADLKTAVCLRPGTEVAFDKNIKGGIVATMRDRLRAYRYKLFSRIDERDQTYRTAVFAKYNLARHYTHHDAFEFPDGKHVLVNDLAPGQAVTVLQLPAEPKPAEQRIEQAVVATNNLVAEIIAD